MSEEKSWALAGSVIGALGWITITVTEILPERSSGVAGLALFAACMAAGQAIGRRRMKSADPITSEEKKWALAGSVIGCLGWIVVTVTEVLPERSSGVAGLALFLGCMAAGQAIGRRGH